MKSNPFFEMNILCKNENDFEVDIVSAKECEPSHMFRALACAIALTIESLEKEYEFSDKDVENVIKVFNRTLEMRLKGNNGGNVC